MRLQTRLERIQLGQIWSFRGRKSHNSSLEHASYFACASATGDYDEQGRGEQSTLCTAGRPQEISKMRPQEHSIKQNRGPELLGHKQFSSGTSVFSFGCFPGETKPIDEPIFDPKRLPEGLNIVHVKLILLVLLCRYTVKLAVIITSSCFLIVIVLAIPADNYPQTSATFITWLIKVVSMERCPSHNDTRRCRFAAHMNFGCKLHGSMQQSVHNVVK